MVFYSLSTLKNASTLYFLVHCPILLNYFKLPPHDLNICIPVAEVKFDFPDDWVMNSPTEKILLKEDREKRPQPFKTQVWVRMNSKSRRMDEIVKVSVEFANMKQKIHSPTGPKNKDTCKNWLLEFIENILKYEFRYTCALQLYIINTS